MCTLLSQECRHSRLSNLSHSSLLQPKPNFAEMSLPPYKTTDHLTSRSGQLNQWLISPQVHQNVAHLIMLYLIKHALITTALLAVFVLLW